MKDTAIAYRQAGLCVLPALLEEKRPAVPSWKPYQSRRPSEAEVEAWFASARAVCILTGAVSGHLELLDFDAGGELFDAWAQRVRAEAPGLMERLVIERSQSGGRHVIYRCDAPICGNLKLAQRNDGDRVVTLIETRGEGGLFLCAPTPGYVLLQGRLESPPVLTEEQREILLSAAWSLNEVIPAPIDAPGVAADRPGDEFNRRGDVRALLRRHGWTSVRGGENEYWRRPGKESGWSATLKDGVFYVFSSNAAPFESSKSYAPFAVYTLLEHGGDFAQAASALRSEGYGQGVDRAEIDLSAFGAEPQGFAPISVGELVRRYPLLRPPVIHGLLRRGETMNVIAPPKTGKSWLALSLAMAVATGQPWLEAFETVPGNVLILDNELHTETLSHRIPTVASALEIGLDELDATLCIQSLRGQLRDLFSLRTAFEALPAGRFALIVLDAFYRFMPRDMDENDNGTMANLYNHIDSYADRLGCSFVLIHHTTKGNQAGKAVTDIGAGAGSQSRATDTHLVMRPHEQPHTVVLDAAVRSWPPIEPIALRWSFPVWTPAPELVPDGLSGESAGRSGSAPAWDVERFVECFVAEQPRSQSRILEEAEQAGLSFRRARRFLELAEEDGKAFRHVLGSRKTRAYATRPLATEPPDTRSRVEAMLAENPELGTKDVAERCGVSTRYVQRIRRDFRGEQGAN